MVKIKKKVLSVCFAKVVFKMCIILVWVYMYNICVHIAILHTLYCGDSHDLGFDSIGVKKRQKL